MGVGEKEVRFKFEKWILGPETPEEKKVVDEYIDKVKEIAEEWKKTPSNPLFSDVVAEANIFYVGSVVGLHTNALVDLADDLRCLYKMIQELKERVEDLEKEIGELKEGEKDG